jgi:hypothetical protein
MRRIQFIEIHEQRWLPSSIRDDITNTLQFGLNLFHAYAPIAPLLQRAIDSTRNGTNGGRSIVDLCSGGGGPWFDLSRKLQSQTLEGAPAPFQIWLTDQYPNLRALRNARAASENRITFYPDPVDAMKVPGELKGFRTMFTSFHHFSPEAARAVLQNAVDAGESIGIFEITRRAPSTICMVIAFDLILSVCTPWIRPFRWSRLFWTYLVPIIPVVLLFDGVVSCLRTYRPPELREMVEQLRASEYQWEIGEHATGKTPVTYLIGYPRTCVAGKSFNRGDAANC